MTNPALPFRPVRDSDTAIERLLYWICERESIRANKEHGVPPSQQSTDPIFKYRFCNVQRENDRVTKWIRENWRDPHKDDPDLWFAMVVARIFNLPPTLKEIGYPVPWDGYTVLQLMNSYTRQKKQIFNGAYIISTNGNAMPKNDYIVKKVLTPLWVACEEIRPSKPVTSLFDFHKVLTHYDGLGSFMAAQVIADLKYTPYYENAKDWMTFAASGPGSRRGLNRLMGRELKAPMPESQWLRNVNHFREIINQCLVEQNNRIMEELGIAPLPEDLHAQDFQNCLCEFDKFERARGGARPKQVYKPNRHAY